MTMKIQEIEKRIPQRSVEQIIKHLQDYQRYLNDDHKRLTERSYVTEIGSPEDVAVLNEKAKVADMQFFNCQLIKRLSNSKSNSKCKCNPKK